MNKYSNTRNGHFPTCPCCFTILMVRYVRWWCNNKGWVWRSCSLHGDQTPPITTDSLRCHLTNTWQHLLQNMEGKCQGSWGGIKMNQNANRIQKFGQIWTRCLLESTGQPEVRIWLMFSLLFDSPSLLCCIPWVFERS